MMTQRSIQQMSPQMTDTTQQAVDYFAGELPPGASARNDKWGAEVAWKWFTKDTGITRRAWAESQCIGKVRELAEAKYSKTLAGVNVIFPGVPPHPQGFCVIVSVWGDPTAPVEILNIPDLLTAAHAACLALEAPCTG